jgi:hypothetical protein
MIAMVRDGQKCWEIYKYYATNLNVKRLHM